MKSNVLLVALSAAVLASCGSSGGAGTDQTAPLKIAPTNFATIPTTPTTPLPTATVVGSVTGVPGSVHPEEGSYVIATGDYPYTVATKYKVTVDELLAVNGFAIGANQQVPGWEVGKTIKIPPNWTEPGAAAAPADTGTATNTTVAGAPPETGAPDSGSATTVAGNCAPGEYVITKEDTSRLKVAKKLDTTVEALDAANANTKGYSAFYPGLKIKTPPKSGC